MAYLDSSSKLTGLVAVTLMAYFDDACLAGIVLPMILGATQFQNLFQKVYDQFQSNSTRLEWIMHAAAVYDYPLQVFPGDLLEPNYACEFLLPNNA